MKLVAEPIYLPDDAGYAAIEDAKLSAKWHTVKSREERMRDTDLTGKCGSCKYFSTLPGKEACGKCNLKDKYTLYYRKRTQRGCKAYDSNN